MIHEIVERFGNVYFSRLMDRWVVGPSAKDAITYCKKLNQSGSGCLINLLGEHLKKSSEVEKTVEEYKKLIDLISTNGIDGSITIKPSQFGYTALDKEHPKQYCKTKMLEIINFAGSRDIFCWIDMESSEYTDFTLDFFKENNKSHSIGICIQANLKRSETDLKDLISLNEQAGVFVRLVKGIYQEDESIAYTEPKAIHKNFLKLIKTAFEKSPGSFSIAVATHHSEAVELAQSLSKKYKKKFEIQVLKGVMPGYYWELREKGIKLKEYVPYGANAFAYSVRRAMKNPEFSKSMLYAMFFDTHRKLHKK